MRRILPIVIVFFTILQTGASAGDGPAIEPVAGGVVVTGSDGGGSGGGSGGGGQSVPVAEVCAGYESKLSAPKQGPQVGPDGGYYVWQEWRCPPGDWQSRSVCIANCPPGVAAIPAPPPPTDEQIRARLIEFVVKPLGRFAPPVEQPTVKAIVGMRFYYSVDPSTYETIAPPTQTFPGGWQVTATLTPGKIGFAAGDKASDCKGPGTSGRTKPGRKQADYEGCYVIFETVPKGDGRLDSTLTTDWTITVTAASVTETIGKTWIEPATTTYNIGLRELQAVGTN